jgi:HPt (histidine-containing phosphotransfer) domain-containing protein
MPEAIDRKHFEAATFGDGVLQREILGLFDAQAEKLAGIIRNASGRERVEAAHTLKGTARGIGAFALADAAEKVEQGDAAALDELSRRIAEAREAAASLLAKN